MLANRCAACTYYHLDPKDMSRGHCHRYPPVGWAHFVPGKGLLEGATVAMVHKGFGCGEWRARGIGDELPVLGEATPVANGNSPT